MLRGGMRWNGLHRGAILNDARCAPLPLQAAVGGPNAPGRGEELPLLAPPLLARRAEVTEAAGGAVVAALAVEEAARLAPARGVQRRARARQRAARGAGGRRRR